MLSPRKRRILKDQFQAALDYALPDFDRQWVESLGERVMNAIELAHAAEKFNQDAADILDTDSDANPLNADLPEVDSGLWLDHSPEPASDPDGYGDPWCGSSPPP